MSCYPTQAIDDAMRHLCVRVDEQDIDRQHGIWQMSQP